MLKKMNTDSPEETKELTHSLEEVGLDMMRLIGVSFFDDINVSHKPFIKSSKAAFEREQILLNKFSMSKTSSLDRECKKSNFILTETGLYKLKVPLFFLNLLSLYHKKESKQGLSYKYMPFEKTRMVVVENQEKPIYRKPFLYGFHFFRTHKSYHLYTDDKDLFYKMQEILIYKTIQHTFHEEYEVKKLIGKGSFAKVYFAIKRQTGKEYAIKAFSKEGLSSQQNGKEGLLNEIDIMRLLNHKNIIKLYEIYETEHSIYLVVDLLSGGEVVSQIQSKGDLSFIEISFMIKNLLEAVAHMHKQGVMHRDIKPENLLLRDSSNVWDIVLADFGLSNRINQPLEDILFKRCGTPGFVAPEILAYKEEAPGFYNEKCDIFSVGALFYLLLTGQKLFKGENCVDVLRENKACEINYGGEELEGVSDLAIDLLKKMLEISPETRISASKALTHKYFETPFPPKKDMKLSLKNYRNFSPVSPHKQGNSPIVMKKSILTGKVETIEVVEASSISPKKGAHFSGKPHNIGGFSEFTHEEGAKRETPKGGSSKANKSESSDKKTVSPLKLPKKSLKK